MIKELLKKQIAMAAGREPADLMIINAKVVNVFTGEIDETPVSMGGGVFLGFTEGEARQVIDAQGRYLVPGLIDAHIHLESSFASPARFAELVLPHGTTTVVADPHEIANVLGLAGIRFMLESAAGLPLSVFITLPSCVPATDFEDAGAILKAADLEPFMAEPRVSGLGEMMNFPGVISGDDDVCDKILLTKAHRKNLDGHAPGVLGRDLDAYLVTGISTTHECSTLEEFRANISRGSYVLIREGSAAKNLLALLPGVTPANARRCAFCCDDRHGEDILRDGHIDHIVRLAVQNGLDPVRAVTLATLNAAEACGLRGKGGIAPGYDADCLLVDDLTHFNVQQVFAGGVPVAENGRLLVPVQANLAPDTEEAVMGNSVHLAPLSADTFTLRVPSGKARVIGLEAHSLVTRALERSVHVGADGVFDARANPDLTKLAVLERHHATGRVGLGIMEGYGLSGGAVATTVAHDSHNIVVAGDNDDDMRLAVEILAHSGGGIVICRDGQVLKNLPLPIAGLLSDDEPEKVAKILGQMIELARTELGVNPHIEPFMTLSFMALPVIPELKLTARGLFDVRTFSFVDVEIKP